MGIISKQQFSNSISLWKLIVGCLLLGTVCLGYAEESALKASGTSGWAVHYYGGPAFWYHAGVTTVTGTELSLNMNKLSWPKQNWNSAKGPLFIRNLGWTWSLAAYSNLRVEKSGEYRFGVSSEQDGKINFRLQINGRMLDEQELQTPIKLSAGEIPIALYVKPEPSVAFSSLKLKVLWQAPGEENLTPLPSDSLTYSPEDLQRTKVYPPRFPLEYAQGLEQRFAQRRFTVDLPESGLYEIAAHFGGLPRLFEVWLDGYPVLYLQGDCLGIKNPLYAATDRNGTTDSVRLDFFHRARAIRPLTKGRHIVDVYAHYSHLVWEDEMKEAMRNFEIGLTPVGKGDSDRSLAIYPEGRKDMVFEFGEPLKVRVEQATDAPQVFRMEVREERGNGKVLWQSECQLKGDQEQAKGEFRYPCDREGAFEYTVLDSSGRMVDGPWAFTVVNPAPLPRPRQTSGTDVSSYRKVLVDNVDCTLPSDPGHLFRDNKTSKVITGPDGAYRVTGTNKLRMIGYIKDGDTWRRAKEGEKGQKRFGWAADWFAYTLKVEHPERPHLVVGYVPNDIKRLVSMYAIDQVTGHYNGWNLDAGDAPAAGAFSPLSFVVWPNSNAIDVMVVCSNSNHGFRNNRQGAMAKIEIYELPDGLPPLPEAAGGWTKDKEFGWNGEQVNLGPVERTMPSLWQGDDLVPGILPPHDEGGFRDWQALHTAWERFGQFSAYRGDNLYIVPVHSYGMNLIQGEPETMLPKCRDIYSTGYRARVIDPMARDIFKLMLLEARKYGVRLVADFMLQRMEDQVPLLAKQAGVLELGILLSEDASGKPWKAFSNACVLNPAHPVARHYLVGLMDVLGRQYGNNPAFAGVRLREWAFWPTELSVWFLNDKLGYDDFTVALFCKETGCQLNQVGDDQAAFAQRRKKLLSDYREKWLSWRCQKVLSLREEMLAALRKYAPKARLFSDGKFNREAGLDARLLADRKDLGWGMSVGKYGGDASVGIEWNSPDPVEFANFDQREPKSIRRAPDNLVPYGGYPQGMNCNQAYRPYPYELQEPALALADGRLETCFYGGQWCLPPADEGLRRFVQAFRAIPDLKYTRFPVKEGKDGRAACWYAREGSDLVLYLVNRTDKSIEVEVSFASTGKGAVNLVSGREFPASRTLRTTIAPFMPVVMKARSVKLIEDVRVPFSQEETARQSRSLKFLGAMQPLAKDAVETRCGTGERYTTAVEDIGIWSRYDQSFSFDDLFKPLEAAWQAKQNATVAGLLNDFNGNHFWWYEAFGWPDDFYVPMKPVDFHNGQSATGTDLLNRYKIATKASKNDPNKIFTQISGYKGDFLTAAQGESMTFRFNPDDGIYELRIWGIFGGDYNPIKVSFMGKPVGQINVIGKKEKQVHQVFSVPLKFAWSPQDITLVGEGKKGLAVSRVEVRALPPLPIRKWQVIGLFDENEDAKGMDAIFSPDKKIDISANYSGLDGKPVSWKALDLGKEKIIQLKKIFPQDAKKEKGAVYLATWIRAQMQPSFTSHSIIYSLDGDSEIWLNGKLLVPVSSGRCGDFKKQKIILQQGWNCLLVKTSPGTEGWNAVVAVNDAGDLEFSGIPPEEKKE